MPRYYLRRLGGAAKTARLAALSPTDHGTSLRGLGLLVRAFPGGDALLSASGRACAQHWKTCSAYFWKSTCRSLANTYYAAVTVFGRAKNGANAT
ncbi:hypothetical protein ACH4A8_21410 [Streptomyces vietnamensis]|uniref:hypothetical protein n=1 Tax=Streptomyces vietnamensis TaxID=362257 RepID=UPI0037880B64